MTFFEALYSAERADLITTFVADDVCPNFAVKVINRERVNFHQLRVRELAVLLGYEPVVPPKKNFKEQWDYDKELYKRRNEIERLFRRLKRFRRIATRYDKLAIFAGFITFALIIDSLV